MNVYDLQITFLNYSRWPIWRVTQPNKKLYVKQLDLYLFPTDIRWMLQFFQFCVKNIELHSLACS